MTTNPNNAPYAEDEIDLIELWQTIWSQKIMITLVTTVITIIAGLWAFSLPKTYQAEIVILPPNSAQVEPIRFADLKEFGIQEQTTQSIYQTLLEHLNATETLIQFQQEPAIENYFQSFDLTETKMLKQIKESLTVQLPAESKQKLVFQNLETNIKFQAQQPEITVMALNTLLEIAKSRSEQEVKQNVMSAIAENLRINQQELALENERVNREIEAEIDRLKEQDQLELAQINQQINLLRSKASQEREYRIARLQVDYDIAEALGIELPVNPLEYNRQASTVTKFDFSSKDPSRYWLGTKALGLEIKELKSRQNDDAFIAELAELFKKRESLKYNPKIEILESRKDNLPFSENLRALKTKIKKLNQAEQQVKNTEFGSYRLQNFASIPESPIKPNKKLIVAVALVLGGMLGLFIALIRGAVHKRRAE
ncbi:MAG: LPS O-antigen chain length determinant protein WzzB [Thiomicrospira sp.]|uniref:Wzz/FepE/Etk N-terminal domain-containing protein n=1 Tax=Thiomicrospira sp. TaxID=935 RepID=UPI0019F70E6A|nr:Wzz/FepE/Etk N-terminal domain-containing protein [Thiomicrospira sp.]MBE0494288.1 LPS O-antigen chain length determinant protein WzzB [Thiomicrospira sp.]